MRDGLSAVTYRHTRCFVRSRWLHLIGCRGRYFIFCLLFTLGTIGAASEGEARAEPEEEGEAEEEVHANGHDIDEEGELDVEKVEGETRGDGLLHQTGIHLRQDADAHEGGEPLDERGDRDGGTGSAELTVGNGAGVEVAEGNGVGHHILLTG